MQTKLKEAAAHGLMSYLLSLGMALTLLGVTGLLRHGWLAALTLGGVHVAVSLISVNRRVALGTGCIALFVGLLWMVIGGAGLLGEVFQALMLHMSGLTTALPMVGAAFTVIICLLCTAASWFVTQRSAGAFPALILLFSKKQNLYLEWQHLRLEAAPLKTMVKIAAPSAGSQALSSLGFLVLQAVILSYGDEVAAAFSNGNKVSNMLLMPVMALGSVLAAYVGQNIGAKKYDRVKKVILLCSICVSITGILLGGGMVHNPELVEKITEACSFIAPVTAYPGEFEMEAMASGAIRALKGEEEVKTYTGKLCWDRADFED